MKWEFLVPLLQLTLPIYRTLNWVLCLGHELDKPETDKQLDFVNHLLSSWDFVVHSESEQHKRYIKRSSQNLDLYLSITIDTNSDVVPSTRPHFYQFISVTLVTVMGANSLDYHYQLEWRYQTDRGTWFMFWDANGPHTITLNSFEGDYYQQRSAFMSQFQSLLDSL